MCWCRLGIIDWNLEEWYVGADVGYKSRNTRKLYVCANRGYKTENTRKWYVGPDTDY